MTIFSLDYEQRSNTRFIRIWF